MPVRESRPSPRPGLLRQHALPLLVCLVAIAGCATTSADFRLSGIAQHEAAIAGRITIIYNDKVFTENCRVTFSGDTLQLAPGGIVLFKVKRGLAHLEQLNCKDVSDQHVQIKGAQFLAQGDGWVSDFGDVVVTWRAEGGFKVSSMFGLIGAIVDAASDDGVAILEVNPPVADVREAFRNQTGVDGRWVTHQLTQSQDSPPSIATPSVRPGVKTTPLARPLITAQNAPAPPAAPAAVPPSHAPDAPQSPR